jgi:hypothetical protein
VEKRIKISSFVVLELTGLVYKGLIGSNKRKITSLSKHVKLSYKGVGKDRNGIIIVKTLYSFITSKLQTT